MKRNQSAAHAIALALTLAAASAAFAGAVAFEEDFALAPDRNIPLSQLIPGTEDFYYYTTLNQQNSGDLDAADKTIKAWLKQFNRTSRVMEMENRQALLKYKSNSQDSLDYLTRNLNLTFSHERESAARQAALQTSLDHNLISRETLTARALSQNAQTLGGFENSALDFLISTKLSDERLHELLSNRTLRPDYDNLPELIAHDLSTRYNSGFGSLSIHHNLLLNQLDAILKLKPELLNDSNFVNTYITKLRPAVGVDLQHDTPEHLAYLDRLWSFVSRLGPQHNSLKANVLYQRLLLDRKLDKWDNARFLDYLQLPRQVWYINQKYMELRERQNNPANLATDFSNVTSLPPVNNDETIVRSYLLHFLADAKNTDAFKPYLEANYLTDAFVEAKLTSGAADPDTYATLIPAARLQELKDRVDIDFAHTNKDLFNPDDPVSLDVNIKNVKSLIVKVYEVNAANFYKSHNREINTDINLDGLVANEERTLDYTDPALRRIPRHFDFPTLKARGVYVVEFIGNGKSSRALIRKGKLRALVRDGSAGQVLTVLDEANQNVTNARLWLAGHEYAADKDGAIQVPFSTNPQPRQPIVLQTGGDTGFASLDFFQHKSETYVFAAQMHVDRESLLRFGKANLIVRPTLFVQNTPVSVSLLEEVTLVITSTDRDGISVTREIPNFKLDNTKESAFEFAVPDRLRNITFAIKAKVQNMSINKKDNLSDSRSFNLNEIDQTALIEDLHLSHINGKFVIDVLGKSGEPLPERPLNLTLKHKDFTAPVHVTLKSDPSGHVALGSLPDIADLTAVGPEGLTRIWHPATDVHDSRTDLPAIHAALGDTIHVPYMGAAATGDRAAFSLLELRDVNGVPTFVADRFSSITVKDAFLEISDLPAGDYDLLMKNEHKDFTIRIAKGETRDGYVLSPTRQLQLRNKNPLQIVSLNADNANLKIQLANATKSTRVHVFATRFLPAYAPFNDLATPAPQITFRNISPLDSLYESGRAIGDEYRYIIDRKYAARFPGNTLARPGLLLNPWAIRATSTTIQDAAQGGQFGGVAGEKLDEAAKASEMFHKRATLAQTLSRSLATSPSLDFLAEPTSLLSNLQPDEKGVITIDRKQLGSHQQFHVVAVDLTNTVYREISVTQPPQKRRDLRLNEPLDPAKHFTEQKQITVLAKGDKLPVTGTSHLESYDTLAKTYRLYSALHPDPTLAEFSFILNWPTMKDDEKREKYSKYACHELNFFLAKKDPAFFETVILPYLKNKKDKTFMDRYLLNDPNLASYLAPWQYGRLNTVERILLAQRLPAESPKTARYIKDNFDLLPSDVERYNFLFNTALSSNALASISSTGSLMPATTGVPGNLVLNGSSTYDGGTLSTAGAIAGRGGAGHALAPATPAPSSSPMAAADKPADRQALRKLKDSNKKLADDVNAPAEAKDQLEAEDQIFVADMDKDLSDRKSNRSFYRKQDKTMEYVENNYYHLPIEAQVASLIPVNAFWNDFAQHPTAPFLSKNLPYPSANFTEIMFALALTDLPFDEPKHDLTIDNTGAGTLTAAGPIIAFHKEIREAAPAADKVPILVSQNYFRYSDRYTFVDNERTDKYVGEEFLTHVVYGCQVVITNPTSSRQKLDALLQLPKGAIPVSNAKYTDGLHLDLEPYQTRALEYAFYFPDTGDFPHYPVQVAKNEKLVASVAPATLKVVATPSKIDTTSWDYISQNGTSDQTLDYLKANNLERTNLEKIAWRMKDKTFYASVIALLRDRHVYNNTLWSYAIKNDDPANINEFLQHQDNFVANCGLALQSPLLTINPVVRHTYQHMEYLPLINARAHRLGQDRTILNDRFYEQYENTLALLRYHPALTDEDLLAATYYLLLQDRIDQALKTLKRVNPANLEEKIQYDYLTAYAAFFADDAKAARPIAEQYKEYKVDRWQKLFTAILAQCDELNGKNATVIDKENRDQQQNILAATEPTFDFRVDNKKIILNYKNVPEIRVNYYLMDIELMFSQTPFLQEIAQGSNSKFSIIKPNETTIIPLDPAEPNLTLDLPEKFLAKNVMIEITGSGAPGTTGQTKSQAYYANSLNVQLAENYGQLTVTSDKTSKAMPKAYVKVYARMDTGQVRFYKDGYTDLRGKFEYASLSTDELDHVQTFSLLVMTDTEGALVKTAQPPKR